MITLSGFDSDHEKFDKLKYIRQLRGVVRWKQAKGKGTLEWATGVGKTVAAQIVLNKMRKTRELKGIVVVPTIQLRQQWEKGLKACCPNVDVDVYVVNTIALKQKLYSCDVLIIDEMHKMAADEFSTIFNKIKYRFTLGLTATLERLDGKHDLLVDKAPVCDTISQQDAIDNGWIADFIEFNLAVPLTRAEVKQQVQLGNQIRFFMSKFDNFDHMISCMHAGNAANYAASHGHDPKEVIKWATQGLRNIHKRKEMIDDAERKIDVAEKLIKRFGVRTMTFSQSTTFAIELAKRLGKDATQYHTKVPSADVMVSKSKMVKTGKGVLGLKKRLKAKGCNYIRSTERDGQWHVSWRQPVRKSGARICEEGLEDFIAGKYKWLISAKALDQGTDVDDVILGVDTSRSENKTQHTQRTGRVARNFKLPDGTFATKVYVNIYIPDWSVPGSKDEQKLLKCQNGANVYEVDDVDELIESLEKIIEQRASS